MPSKTLALVVTWNSRDVIEDCLESLKKQNINFIVLDNSSTDGTPEWIELNYPRDVLVKTGANLGYAAANNIGLHAAMEQGYKFGLILNPDVTLGDNAVLKLESAMERNTRAGIICPKIINSRDGKIWFAGSFIDWDKGQAPHVGIGEEDHGQYDHEKLIERACGAAMLVRLEAFLEVGGMDDAYFLYFEETDWSLRLAAADWQVWYEPKAVGYHFVSSSTGFDSPLYWYYMTRNNLRFMKIHGQKHFRRFSHYLLSHLYHSTIHRLRHPTKKSLRCIVAGWKGYMDFLLGRYGRRRF